MSWPESNGSRALVGYTSLLLFFDWSLFLASLKLMHCIPGKVCVSLHELWAVYQLVAFLGILRDEMYYINLNCFYCYTLRVNISQVIWNLLPLGRQVFSGVIPVFHVEALLKHVAQNALRWCSLLDAAKLAATLISCRKKESWGGRRQVSWACFTTFPPAITLFPISTAPVWLQTEWKHLMGKIWTGSTLIIKKGLSPCRQLWHLVMLQSLVLPSK